MASAWTVHFGRRGAGINLGGGYATFPGVIGTAVTKVGPLEVARTGLGESQALAAGGGGAVLVVAAAGRAGQGEYPDERGE